MKDLIDGVSVELDLTLCPGIERKTQLSFDLTPISCALRHNTYFQHLKLSDSAPKDVMLCVANILRHNVTLRSLSLIDLEASTFFQATGDMIRDNQGHSLIHFDVRGSDIPTEGILAISQALQSWPHALLSLNLSKCNITGKRATLLIGALLRNYGMSISIQSLDLSYNKFDVEGSKALEYWLWNVKDYSHLGEIKLSHCGLDLTAVCRSFRSLQYLHTLDLSHNKLDRGATQLLIVTIQESHSLNCLKVDHCALSSELLQNLIFTFVTNPKLNLIRLYAGYNNLPSKEALQLATALKKSLSLHTFDLSGYKLSADALLLILKSIARKPTLDTLILDQCYKSPDKKKVSQDDEDIAMALRSFLRHTPSLKALSIQHGYQFVAPLFFEKLQNNTTLLELRVAHNRLADEGAFALSELLRFNTTLASLHCDENSIRLDGWRSLALAFKRNKTLTSFPYPWQDIQALLSSLPEDPAGKVRSLVDSIQSAVGMNSNPHITSDRQLAFPSSDLCIYAERVVPIDLTPIPALAPVPQHLLQLQAQALSQEVDFSAWIENDIFRQANAELYKSREAADSQRQRELSLQQKKSASHIFSKSDASLGAMRSKPLPKPVPSKSGGISSSLSSSGPVVFPPPAFPSPSPAQSFPPPSLYSLPSTYSNPPFPATPSPSAPSRPISSSPSRFPAAPLPRPGSAILPPTSALPRPPRT